MGRNHVVPLSVKVCWPDVQEGHFFLRDSDSFWVRIDIEIGLDGQSLARARVGNQIHDDLMSFQRTTPPIRRDVAKHPVLDFVPLRGTRRKMTNLDAQSDFIGELLQLLPPESAVSSNSVAWG